MNFEEMKLNKALDYDYFFKNVDSLWLNALLNNPFQGIIAINEFGDIIFINDFFLKLLNTDFKTVLGEKIWDVIPDCRLHDTVFKEHSQYGETLTLNGREFIIGRFPLKNKKRVIGAVVKTLFPDMITAKEISNRISHPVAYGSVFTKPLCCCMDIIGESEPMLFVKKLARKASRTSSNLLITGESGTGKSILAEAIHNRSSRSNGPFIKVNCSAIPESLIESELFGYVDGAFTGARKGGKPGKFELANGGTIFLDEIGDMPLFMQPKLLQVIQERHVERIGSTKSVPLDVRIIAATNQNLEKMVKERKFRDDLYYRLNVLNICIPPLRERVEDIPYFIDGLIKKINTKLGSDAKGVTEDSIELIKSYSWPGNVRELENFLEQAINWSYDSIIDVSKLPVRPWDRDDSNKANDSNIASISDFHIEENYQQLMEDTERNIIIKALLESKGNKSKTAKKLNMHRTVLYKKLEKFNIDTKSIEFYNMQHG
ncbi:limonene hydroxylase [Clostridium homopropionicum DSM 5847]|uniref:Limonene hydroxylase n=1 Tax=Clostridium homopropionicum DSM 5847 TaxID=1121318 RepID=A0A0L6Z833_9CLOT|nr:sigma 54-interacting transcriptional regulator [Clostridium homopropionicum]KOA19131.1 limonene hydroxylase [Clostridium homopropionicum DSM 5847]SFG84549.1 Transcriptional regulator containing PAS, AAA-type ATPase, and DNA-binding Fis domains [Clostridium homopropionicum]